MLWILAEGLNLLILVSVSHTEKIIKVVFYNAVIKNVFTEIFEA